MAAVRSVGTQPVVEDGDPLHQYAIGQAVLSVLTEYEEHRLRACIREGMQLYRLRATFDLTAIDDSIEALRDVVHDDAEIITYLPSLEGGNDDSIELVVLLASRVPEPELKAHFEGRYGTVEAIEEQKHLADDSPELSPRSLPARKASFLSPRTKWVRPRFGRWRTRFAWTFASWTT